MRGETPSFGGPAEPGYEPSKFGAPSETNKDINDEDPRLVEARDHAAAVAKYNSEIDAIQRAKGIDRAAAIREHADAHPMAQLARRLETEDGYQIFGRSGESEETKRIAFEILEELATKDDTETVAGTTFSVAEAKTDNNIFGQIVLLRTRGKAKNQ